MGSHDAVLILGGGVREGGELPPWSIARFERALELQREGPFVCLSAGTTHRPPPLDTGFPISESSAGARYLLSRGIASHLIRIENASYDTIGNAYLTKLLHVDPPGWSSLLVVTSEFHMPRSREIFEWVFGLDQRRYSLTFEASPDVGMSSEQLSSRRSKELKSLESFRELRPRITSLGQLHEWFFTIHDAYSAGDRWRKRSDADPRLVDSY
jgi:hypothetical protein